MTERQMLEQIAAGSCYEIGDYSESCHKCPVYKNGCGGFDAIAQSRHYFSALPESVRAAASAKLAEMDKGRDNSIIDIQPERDIVTLHRMRGGEYETVELTTAQFDAIFDMVKAMKEVGK